MLQIQAVRKPLRKEEFDMKYGFCRTRSLLQDQNNYEGNRRASPVLAEMNELKPMHPSDCETVSLEKFKLEVEQRVNNPEEK